MAIKVKYVYGFIKNQKSSSSYAFIGVFLNAMLAVLLMSNF